MIPPRGACRITHAPFVKVLVLVLGRLLHHLLHRTASVLATLRLRCGLAALRAGLAGGLLRSLLHRAHFFFPFFLRDFPAVDRAIAIACF